MTLKKGDVLIKKKKKKSYDSKETGYMTGNVLSVIEILLIPVSCWTMKLFDFLNYFGFKCLKTVNRFEYVKHP